MINVYHEVEPYREVLAHVLEALKPGGRPRAPQAKNHVLSPEVAEPEFRAAGFEVVARRDAFIDRPDEEDVKWMIVCRRPVK